MVERGISLWRQIGETLLNEIKRGVLKPGDRVTSEGLGARFGVNRHTAMRAISFLEEEGLVEIQRGRGAYVANAITYRFGARTRQEQNLLENQRIPTRKLIDLRIEKPKGRIATELDIKATEKVAVVTLLGMGDGTPISLGVHYFPLSRLPGIDRLFEEAAAGPDEKLSITQVLAEQGIDDYRRKAIRITSRAPSDSEIEHLRVPRNQYVLETEITNIDAAGTPVFYAKSAFASSRVVFAIDM